MTDKPVRSADPARPAAAPVPVGDVVPGDPPVPITVWQVDAPSGGDTMSDPLGVRLVHNLTHPADLIIDATDGPQLARAIITAGRTRLPVRAQDLTRPGPTAPLIVTGRPTTDPTMFFTAVRTRLEVGGCLAVVLAHTDPTVHADLIIAAHNAGLGYLQHIVAADPVPGRVAGMSWPLRVHTDVLILTRTRDDHRETPDD